MKYNSHEDQQVLDINIPQRCFYLQSPVGIDASFTAPHKGLFASRESKTRTLTGAGGGGGNSDVSIAGLTKYNTEQLCVFITKQAYKDSRNANMPRAPSSKKQNPRSL